MAAFPTIRDAAADQQFQLAVREQHPKSYEFEARYVDHEMAHVGHLFASGVCPVQGKEVLEFGCNIGATSIVLAHYGAQVTAVDINPTSLEIARLNTKRYGATEFASIQSTRASGSRLRTRSLMWLPATPSSST